MKIFQPQEEDADEGFATSFTFDDSDEQQNFADFLNNMEISYLKSKFPVIDEGKVRYQTGFVVPRVQEDEELDVEEEQEQVVEETKPKRKSKKVVEEAA